MVFDAAENFVPLRLPFVLAFTVAALGALLISGALVRHESQRRGVTGGRTRIGVVGLLVALVVVVMGSLIVVMVTGLSSASADDTRRAIESSPVVEGPIEHFHPMPASGHDSERFDVAGVHFEYSHWSVSQGFNQDVTVGGPIRNGLQVRIHYVRFGTPPDHVIVRLEVRQ